MALVWYGFRDGAWATDPLPGTGEVLAGESWQQVHFKLKDWFRERGWPATVDLPLTPTVRSARGAATSPFELAAGAPAAAAAAAAPAPPTPTPAPPDSDDDDGGSIGDFSLFD